MKLLKTCGIMSKLENYNNIDMLGFNFIESSKRYIAPEKASEIDTPFSTLRVGVFGISSPQPSDYRGKVVKWKDITKSELVDIILTAKKAKMNAIQIHGNCDFAYLKLYNYLVIQSIPLSQAKGGEQSVDFFIIEGKKSGTGEEYDYGEINKLNIEKKFLVTGGINKKNVLEIFEIFKDNKYFCGVDITIGVDNG